jgi:homoserine dehydrogenase
MSKKIKIALLGCGTVGSGVLTILDNLHRQDIELVQILVRNEQRATELSTKLNLDRSLFVTDVSRIINNPEIDIVVELMGQVELTKQILLDAIAKGKNIVTANKDLLALEGEALFEAAKQNKATILYEAAVAGGIPIIATLKQSLCANHILEIQGIINGTTNYILDVMKSESESFDEALKLAQGLGFAESDPTNDIDGHDAAYKIAILAAIISGKRVDVKKVYREGIRNISSADIKSAGKRQYEIKLLGIINNLTDELDVRVHPVFVSKTNPLSSVRLENNAILIKGNAVKELTLIGKGAGSLPTASSVVADILMLASQLDSSSNPHPQYVCPHSDYAKIKDIKDVVNSFYIRVSMYDKVGVLKDLGEITAKNGANVKFIDQYDASGQEAHADFIVDPIKESAMQQMIKDIKALDSIKAVESVIRVI